MAYRTDKEGNIVIDGWEKGIAPSPHFGLGDIKCANIYTESGEIMANYARTQQSQTATNGSVVGGDFGINTSTSLFFNPGSKAQLQNGTWITISGSSGTPANGSYYISGLTGTTHQTFSIASTFGGATLTGFTGNIGSFVTIDMGLAVSSTTETYFDSSDNTQYRYYILDTNGRVWVHDTGDTSYVWALIDSAGTNGGATGISVYNGWLFVFAQNIIYYKQTAQLGDAPYPGGSQWSQMTAGLNSETGSKNPHYAFVGHQGTLNYTDGGYVGTIFSNSTTTANAVNIWSYGKYTVDPSTDTFTITTLYGGDFPLNGATMTFTSTSAVPAGLTVKTRYFVINASVAGGTFQVSATAGGSAVNITDAGTGTQYFNTFDPLTSTTFIQSFQACTLPKGEIAQSMAEIGNSLVIGTKTNALYLWDQVSAQPSNFILLPENNTINLLTVNNVVYAFAGQKGNVYVTNGSIASVAFTVPDYITGIIEPYYSWGGAMYVRGRVWFSIQQGTGTSNIGGVWSFIPTQNFYMGMDVPGQGLALRLEHQNSYGSYSGYCSVLLPSFDQSARGVQYWSAWFDGTSSYGIDFSSTTPYIGGQPLVETDIIPVGSYVAKENYAGIELKLAAPLVSGESVQILYRNNLSFSSFTSAGTYSFGDTTENLSTRFTVPFANVQWVQFQVKLTSTASNPSFVRLKQLMIYKRV